MSITLGECVKVTGKPPIGTRWIDTNKGDHNKPNYRSRLVAKEYKINNQPELYAATPPTECMRLLISRAAEKKTNKMIYIDISRAYFYAKSVRPTYVKLPAEDPRSSDPTCCGRLLMSMYGTRDAALNWHEEYAETLRQADYVRGIANPCLFYNHTTDVSVMVHGDDFLATGDGKAVESLKKVLSDAYKVKVETLGGDAGDLSEIRVLNRVLRRTDAGYRLEADPRHAEAVIRDLGLIGAKGSKLPGSKEEKRRHSEVGSHEDVDVSVLSAEHTAETNPVGGSSMPGTAPSSDKPDPSRRRSKTNEPHSISRASTCVNHIMGKGRGGDLELSAIGPSATPNVAPKADPNDDDETLLIGEEARLFRGVAARLNYVGPDRPDMRFAVKEAARLMCAPRKCDWRILRKIGRYLINRPRLALIFNWQRRPCQLDGYSDSDWAGCAHSRKSTSGGVVMLGAHPIKSWSRQQRTIALSSAEAETYGMVACSAELLGIQACAKDLGIPFGVSVYADASAALGIIKRRGVGKLRHIRTQSLWLQEAHATKRIHFEKIDGSRNPSDLLTKHLAEILMDRHMRVIGALPEDGRASTAPTLASLCINELPLCGHVIGEDSGMETNSLVQSESKHAIDRQKPCMRYGGHVAGSSGQVVCDSPTSTGAIKVDGYPCLSCPALHADDSLDPHMSDIRGRADVCPGMYHLERAQHVKEPASVDTRSMTGKVAVLSVGCTPPGKRTLHHGIVSGSSLKPCCQVGQTYESDSHEPGVPPAMETDFGMSPGTVCGCSKKPKVPVRRGDDVQLGPYEEDPVDASIPRAAKGGSPSVTAAWLPPAACAAASGDDGADTGVGTMPPVKRRDYRCRLDAVTAMAAKGGALRGCRRHLLKCAWADMDVANVDSDGSNWSNWKGRLKVEFSNDVVTHYVPAYSEVYGVHPRSFHFGPNGDKIPVGPIDPANRLQKTRYTHRHSEGIDTLSLCLASEEEYECICYISSSSHMSTDSIAKRSTTTPPLSSTSECERAESCICDVCCIGCLRGSSRPFCTAGEDTWERIEENAKQG